MTDFEVVSDWQAGLAAGGYLKDLPVQGAVKVVVDLLLVGVVREIPDKDGVPLPLLALSRDQALVMLHIAHQLAASIGNSLAEARTDLPFSPPSSPLSLSSLPSPFLFLPAEGADSTSLAASASFFNWPGGGGVRGGGSGPPCNQLSWAGGEGDLELLALLPPKFSLLLLLLLPRVASFRWFCPAVWCPRHLRVLVVFIVSAPPLPHAT